MITASTKLPAPPPEWLQKATELLRPFGANPERDKIWLPMIYAVAEALAAEHEGGRQEERDRARRAQGGDLHAVADAFPKT